MTFANMNQGFFSLPYAFLFNSLSKSFKANTLKLEGEGGGFPAPDYLKAFFFMKLLILQVGGFSFTVGNDFRTSIFSTFSPYDTDFPYFLI